MFLQQEFLLDMERRQKGNTTRRGTEEVNNEEEDPEDDDEEGGEVLCPDVHASTFQQATRPVRLVLQ